MKSISAYFLYSTLLVFLYSCPQTNDFRNYDFVRTPSRFQISLYSPDSTGPQKYLVTWLNPSQTKNFEGSYIILDTANWKRILGDPKKAGKKIFKAALDTIKSIDDDKNPIEVVISRPADSLLIQLDSGDEGGPVRPIGAIGSIKLFAIDTSGSINDTDKAFHFALISKYSDGEIGRPKFTTLPIFDNTKPHRLLLNKRYTSNQLFLNWKRPKDQTSFFYPEADTGIISRYTVEISDLKIGESETFRALDPASIQLTITKPGNKKTEMKANEKRNGIKIVYNDTLESENHEIFIHIEDNKRFNTIDSLNNFGIVITGLIPEQRYFFRVFAVDSAGNAAKSSAENTTITMTDTTKPDKIDSLNKVQLKIKNSLSFQWPATKDSRPIDTTPNANIKYYHIKRLSINTGGYASLNSADDTIQYRIEAAIDPKTPFTDGSTRIKKDIHGNDSSIIYNASFFFLPPGEKYRVEVWAEDNSGHLSDTTTIVDSIGIKPGDCPDGFIYIHQPGFCIEKFEHFDKSTLRYITNVTRKEAESICNALSSEKDTVQLCSDAQWERACMGDSSFFKHPYGVQSLPDESSDSLLREYGAEFNNIQSKCNFSTDDEEMAFDFSLRQKICTTNEGVYDMMGHFSEWMKIESENPDSLAIRGGNYLRPTANTSEIKKMALCTQQATPKQNRPHYYSNCLSSDSNLTIVMRSLKEQPHHCTDSGKAVHSYSVIEDSTIVKVTYKDKSSEEIDLYEKFKNYLDSAQKKTKKLRLKPIDTIAINKESMIKIGFKKDTIIYDILDYRPFKRFPDSLVFYPEENQVIDSTYTVHPLLQHEANENWKILPIKKIYGYIIPTAPDVISSKAAKPYYSHKVVGFRCCSTSKNDSE